MCRDESAEGIIITHREATSSRDVKRERWRGGKGLNHRRIDHYRGATGQLRLCMHVKRKRRKKKNREAKKKEDKANAARGDSGGGGLP